MAETAPATPPSRAELLRTYAMLVIGKIELGAKQADAIKAGRKENAAFGSVGISTLYRQIALFRKQQTTFPPTDPWGLRCNFTAPFPALS